MSGFLIHETDTFQIPVNFKCIYIFKLIFRGRKYSTILLVILIYNLIEVQYGFRLS